MQEVLQRLGLSKARSTLLHPQSDGVAGAYVRVKTIEEHLRKVVASHQRDWDMRLPIFLLAYRASTHGTMGLTPANLTCGRDLRLPCDLLFESPPDKKRPTIDHAADLVDRLHDIHSYARQHMKLTTNRIKTRYDRQSNSAECQEGDQVWLYRSTRTKRKLSKLQPSWECPYSIVTRINDVVYRIERHPGTKIMVIRLDQLAP
jgi:hypothetical protein